MEINWTSPTTGTGEFPGTAPGTAAAMYSPGPPPGSSLAGPYPAAAAPGHVGIPSAAPFAAVGQKRPGDALAGSPGNAKRGNAPATTAVRRGGRFAMGAPAGRHPNFVGRFVVWTARS